MSHLHYTSIILTWCINVIECHTRIINNTYENERERNKEKQRLVTILTFYIEYFIIVTALHDYTCGG